MKRIAIESILQRGRGSNCVHGFGFASHLAHRWIQERNRENSQYEREKKPEIQERVRVNSGERDRQNNSQHNSQQSSQLYCSVVMETVTDNILHKVLVKLPFMQLVSKP